MLIHNAEVAGSGLVDVRIDAGRIVSIGSLIAGPGERSVDAQGGALLPGLHDHHIHLRATAAALESIRCGPPEVLTADALRARLGEFAKRPGIGWIRGNGYHESVAGAIDRAWLDAVVPDLPVRIQHRSGRLWMLNSAALALLRPGASGRAPGLLPQPGTAQDGRLFDQDHLLAAQLRHRDLPFQVISRQLAGFGITGITDMNPGNDKAAHAAMRDLQDRGELLQRVHLGGREELADLADRSPLSIGPHKIHLHDHDLPAHDDFVATLRRVHDGGRPVAVHCVTELALVFTLAAFEEAGAFAGDRIEHASVTPDALLGRLARQGLTIVTQPHFITERGREYLQDLPREEHRLLYRCRAFLEHGVPLAGGSDAPFGSADPWRCMRAAVERTTVEGMPVGPDERLTPEEALALFTGRADSPAEPRRIAAGEPADLCLLHRPWMEVRHDLDARHVRMTWIDGEPVSESRR